MGACEHSSEPADSVNWREFSDFILSEESKFHNVVVPVFWATLGY